ncbi:hypothetical protein LOTGIDRAFT_157526 [Lottia gigantea]|uniref:DNA-directed DNA polymerase n=1 Tax=Lottia gigantea TaxID=225164 RepID=V4AVJ6_LOTGI|nr:hypothetical protein LOTGIDRAFT_157526 [Lottia gigantea]ESP01348.1 hypothetical protein LOTGIDRAFT_157526 [Lottia gigantea]
MIFRKNNFKEIKRPKKGSGVTLLKKINEYIGINCYIPSDGYCFVKCVNRVLNEDYTRDFQDFINSFSKSNRKGVMTTARICEFNKKFNTYFQIYMPKHRHFQPKKVSKELDWVFYLHKEHFCLIRRNNKTLGIKEIEDNYDENGWYYLYHYDKEMIEEEWYETTRMVPKHTEKENVEKVNSHTHPFIRYFISIKGGRVSANRKSFETNKMDEICSILKEYNASDTDNIIDLFKEYSDGTKDKTELHSRLKKIKCIKLMAFDANGLYASAMSDLDSEYPRAESGRSFLPEENKEFVKLFNEQKFRPRTAILKVWCEYPKNMFFQPIPAKDKITFTNKEGKKETGTKIRFRNGFCHNVLTSVDIQEIVKAGGQIIKILDGIVYEENFKTPPYRYYILILTLYGKSIQKDITTSRHLWSEATLKANYDSHFKSYEKVNDSIVEINEEEKEFIPPKSTRLTPSHLGSFAHFLF